MCRLIAGLHAKDPDQRYRSAELVERILRQCISHIEQPDVNPIPQQLLLAPATGTRWAKCAAGFVLALLVSVLAMMLTRHQPDDRDAHDSTAASARWQAESDPAALSERSDNEGPQDDAARWDDGMVTELQTAAESLETIRDSSDRFFDLGPHRRVQQDTSLTLPNQ
jgi:hypothetical protein